MKIMHINSVYKNGSTGKIVYDLHSYLQRNDIDSVVCYGRLKSFDEINVYKTCGEFEARVNRTLNRITGLLYGGCFMSTNKLINIIKKESPDIVHIHCINGYFVNIYRIITFLNKHKIKTVLTLHAEFMHTANCKHALDCEKWKSGCGKCPRLKKETYTFCLDNTALSWRKMKKAFEGFENLKVVSVSKWLENRAKQSPILMNKNHSTILNGIDTSIFNANVSKLKKEHSNFKNKKIVFHATAEFSDEKNHFKGGFYFLEIAKKFLDIDENVLFVVAGKYTKIHNLPSNVLLLGEVMDSNELAEWYAISDVTVLTSKRETFSMVVAESLCCGTPVIGFEAGGPELIALTEYSVFVKQEDINSMIENIKTYLFKKQFDRYQIAEKALSTYDKSIMINSYLKLYDELYRNGRSVEK